MNTTHLLSTLLLASGLVVGCGDSEPEADVTVDNDLLETPTTIDPDGDTYNESVAGTADIAVEPTEEQVPDRAASAAENAITGEGSAFGEAALMDDEVRYRQDEYITNWDALPAEDVDGLSELAEPELDN